MPPTIQKSIYIVETNNLESVTQYHDGTVKIRFDHSKPRIPPMVKYTSSRHSFSGSSSTSKRDQDQEKEKNLENYLDELNLNKQKEKNIKKDIKDIKQKGVKEETSQVNSAYYTVDNEANMCVESDNESIGPTQFDMLGEEIHNQLNVIKKPFEINWDMLNSEFDYEKNKGKREKHRKTHNKEEKKLIFDKWKSVMQDLRMNIHFFDFVDNYYSKLNVLTKWTKENKTTVESSHPPKENILINVGKDLVKVSPFKLPPKIPEKDEERKIIEQNNYTNKCLNVIGNQLDKIENKIDSINIKLDSIKIETPLIKTQELKTGLSFKTSQTKTRKKIDQMLKELNKVKGEPSTINVINKNDEVNMETCYSNLETTSEEEIDNLEKAFGKLQRITNKKPNPTTFTKNWYPRPTPLDMQFEERSFQHQFSVSADKLYEWNIDGLSEQEVLNKLSHLTMVANSYMTNHQLTHAEIIDLLVTRFSGKLKSWWEKHLTEESRDLIKHSVKKDEEGNPIFDERIGMGIPDGVNSLVFTIIRHFIGTPSNITSRIHDQLSNLKCPTMSDFRWYEDVFNCRVMLREDSNKPYWKEKFIDGLPNLFAHKIRAMLSNFNGIIDYDTLTYGDIISTIKQEGLKMCIEQRIAKQQRDNKRKAKYEMGNFCE
jgi:hypothetical protein